MPSYPDISDYTDSVQNAASQVIDPVLQKAKPRLKGNKPEMMSGGCAVVYPFQDGGDIYAVKCWLRDIGDLRAHYRLVERFLSSCQSAYFVGFAYVEKGIIAKDQIWPFLRMKWVGGKSVLEFVSANVCDGPALILLAERYLAMSQRLHMLGVAHGDLQGSNIKVVGSGTSIDFQLIDYDTLIVPAAHGHKAEASALPSYQHPKRGASRCYSGKEDYFSELVIYLSLLAVAEKPTVWSKYPKGDPGMKDEDRHDKDMLFVKEDFLSDRPTEVFKELFALSPLVKNLTLILWNFTRRSTIEQLIPLEEVVKLARNGIKQAPPATQRSEFESLLICSTLSGDGWLDNSSFAPRKSPPRITHHSATEGGPKSFDELIRSISTPAAANESKFQTSRPLPPKSEVFAGWKVLAGIGIFVALIALLSEKDSQTIKLDGESTPALQSATTPTVGLEPIKHAGQETTVEPSPVTGDPARSKARLAWKADLQRRKEENDAQFVSLEKRFSNGVSPGDVESFNTEVKAAERERDELEAEIIRFNSGIETPTRYDK